MYLDTCFNSFFLLLSSIPWYGYTTVYLTIHLLRDILAVSSCFYPFTIWITWSFKVAFWELHILCLSPLSGMCFADIFSQSIACVLILATGSFTEQKCLLFDKSHLSIFFLFWMMLLIAYLRTFHQAPAPKNFSPTFSHKNYIVPECFTSQPMTLS